MRNSRASLFLMELMISILFFSLSSAVCIQLFVKAHTINQATEDKSNAILIAQDISEYFHYTNGNKTQLLSYYTDYEEAESDILLYFTEAGAPCNETAARYVAVLTFGQNLSYATLDINVKLAHEDDSLYSSSLKKYIQAVL